MCMLAIFLGRSRSENTAVITVGTLLSRYGYFIEEYRVDVNDVVRLAGQHPRSMGREIEGQIGRSSVCARTPH